MRQDDGGFDTREPHLRAMLNSALDAVIAIDRFGRIIAFNPAAERTFGRAATDVLWRDMSEMIVPPALRDAHRAGLQRYLETGRARVLDRRIEITGMRADGSEFPVELTITRINVPGEDHFVGYLRDISDRKAAEAELRASRARIVEAGDEARRRIERDLHDGAQQRLVGLGLTLRLARDRLAAGGDGVAALLDEAIDDLQDATAELRELARGIHPAVLTDGGLDPALSNLARRSALNVTRAGEVGRRLAAPVEATAYFAVAEALTNAAKYADASHVTLYAGCDDGRLVIEVSDDGTGGADQAAGTGLAGIVDRIAALDGALTVVSPPGVGTIVRVELPCAS